MRDNIKQILKKGVALSISIYYAMTSIKAYALIGLMLDYIVFKLTNNCFFCKVPISILLGSFMSIFITVSYVKYRRKI